MLLYRIKADLMFRNKAEGDEVWARLKAYLKDKDIANIAEEESYIEYHECPHGESPPLSCVLTERFEKE